MNSTQLKTVIPWCFWTECKPQSNSHLEHYSGSGIYGWHKGKERKKKGNDLVCVKWEPILTIVWPGRDTCKVYVSNS